MHYVKRVGLMGYRFLATFQHMLTHILIGLLYAWALRHYWQDLPVGYTVLAIVGSVLIDLDHILYFFTYGRREWYAVEVRKLLKLGQIKHLFYFLKINHKHNTGLVTHNFYFFGIFFILSLVSFRVDWNTGVVLFGSIVLHFAFDIVDDVWVFGHVNESWKRLRRGNRARYSGEFFSSQLQPNHLTSLRSAKKQRRR